MILVDTSAWIDYLNGHASKEANYLAQLIENNEPIVVPDIILTEILLGIKTEKEATRIANLLEIFEASPSLERKDYLAAAQIYRSCRSQGYTIRSTIDCLIAQLCLRHQYQLLTKDKDFQTIAKYTKLILL